MPNPRLAELAQTLHDAVHSGTIDFTQVDAVISELRQLGLPVVGADTELGPAIPRFPAEE